MNGENLLQIKPKYLQYTDKWALKIAQLWCLLSLIVGILYTEVAMAIVAPILTFIMIFGGKFVVKLLVSFMKVNPFAPKSIYKYIILFFWSSGIYGCLSFLFEGFFGDMETLNQTFFTFTASIFPIGVSIGASSMWCSEES